jgi:hypothetical protein
MAMHEYHDEELILDLRNDPDATEAEISARLDGCEQCLADLAEQREIAAYLAELEPPSLTGSERAALRSAVLAEVEPAPVIPLSPRRAWDWTRLGTVAAALFGVVAIAGLVSVIGGGTDNAATVADSVAASDTAESDDGAMALEAAPEAEAAGDDAAAEETANDFAGASLAPPSDLVVDLGEVDRPGLSAGLDTVRRQVAEMTESSGVLQRMADEVDASCVGELTDPGSIRAIVTATVDGLDVEVYLDAGGAEFGYASLDCSTYDLP